MHPTESMNEYQCMKYGQQHAYTYAMDLFVKSQPSNPRALKAVIRFHLSATVNQLGNEDTDAGICSGLHYAVLAYAANMPELTLDAAIARFKPA